jgi:phospholipase/carboxylesterase
MCPPVIGGQSSLCAKVAGIDDLVHDVRRPEGEPDGALVLLHGRGTSERDLEPLLDELDPDRRLVGVMPRGPLSLPPGGAHWYQVRRVGYPGPETFFPTFERLSGWFDSLPDALGVPVDRTVLGGFSQGAVMAYALGLGEGRPRPAALMALSGFIPSVDGFALDLDGLEGYPVAIGHGRFDPVIEAEFGRRAHERLSDAGADVLWRESPVGHAIDPEFLPELREFVARAAGSAGARDGR